MNEYVHQKSLFYLQKFCTHKNIVPKNTNKKDFV